jgi:hypothetical protein
LFKFLDGIPCAFNDKMAVGGIFCDLAEAFDHTVKWLVPQGLILGRVTYK